MRNHLTGRAKKDLARITIAQKGRLRFMPIRSKIRMLQQLKAFARKH